MKGGVSCFHCAFTAAHTHTQHSEMALSLLGIASGQEMGVCSKRLPDIFKGSLCWPNLMQVQRRGTAVPHMTLIPGMKYELFVERISLPRRDTKWRLTLKAGSQPRDWPRSPNPFTTLAPMISILLLLIPLPLSSNLQRQGNRSALCGKLLYVPGLQKTAEYWQALLSLQVERAPK